MKIILKILLFFLQLDVLSAYSSSNVVVNKFYDRTKVSLFDSITVMVEVQNFENEGLRGFYFTEFIPDELIITPLSVDISGVSSVDFTFEKFSSPLYNNLTAYRWILENPPDFVESNPIQYQQKLTIKYSVSTESSGTFRLEEYNWAGYYANLRSAFGYSEISESVEVTFSDSTVPVELISFNAELNENKVLLKWTTASEINNYGFIIEKSFTDNSNDYKEIGFIPAMQNFSYNSYHFFDNDLTTVPEIYYRLKQVDLDGSSKYAGKTSIKILAKNFILFQNYPNPFNPSTLISFYLPEDSYIELIIYNFLGEIVKILIEGEVKSGYHYVNFDAGNLPAGRQGFSTGIYFCQLKSGNFSDVKKIILIK